jgi:hypothetical protein
VLFLVGCIAILCSVTGLALFTGWAQHPHGARHRFSSNRPMTTQIPSDVRFGVGRGVVSSENCETPNTRCVITFSRTCMTFVLDGLGFERKENPMFSPTLHHGTNTSHSIEINNPTVGVYLNSLQPVNLSEVGLLELLHTLFNNTADATADTLDQYIDEAKGVTAYYRDAAGSLVVRHDIGYRDRLSLLWPVAQPVDNPTEATIVRGDGDEVFIEASAANGMVPLAAAVADRHNYSWGYKGKGPINLYMALVYAIDAEEPPLPPPELNEDPRSLYGWLTRQDRHAELRLSWPELVRRVSDDRPLR